MTDVYVVGAGAIGLSLAHALSQRHHVSVITRALPAQKWVISESQQTKKINAKPVLLAHIQPRSITHCFICVKAYQVSQAITDVLPYLSDEANIFISHNGMYDLSEVINQLTPDQALFFLSTARGALKLDNHHVKITGYGDTYLGACNVKAHAMIKRVFETFFQDIMPACFIHEDITLLRWQKLLVNIAINPLTALHQIPNGQLRQPKFSATILALLNEACTVANKAGVKVSLPQALDSAYLVMSRTSANFSSMAQDLKHGRKTEIEAICGYVVALGKSLNVATPYNAHMLQALTTEH
ncbi:ketopantoate reductase family protein [Pseudoalteromonas sp. T1lg23B]|uniref:ketopantoate reductase family protein n=1 Tax=Pseudoalteromonas sp. T1lg23B TaxID=2077097 RepID=UPI000CF5F45B|nr:2-dehydropantoate 2-reductase [Pseudoalteromonas sp. T1lg23B]